MVIHGLPDVERGNYFSIRRVDGVNPGIVLVIVVIVNVNNVGEHPTGGATGHLVYIIVADYTDLYSIGK